MLSPGRWPWGGLDQQGLFQVPGILSWGIFWPMWGFSPCSVSDTFFFPSFGIFPLSPRALTLSPMKCPFVYVSLMPLAHLYISFLPFSSTHVAAKPSDWWATEETMWMFSWGQELKPVWGWSLSSRGHNESTLRCWWHISDYIVNPALLFFGAFKHFCSPEQLKILKRCVNNSKDKKKYRMMSVLLIPSPSYLVLHLRSS